MTGKQIESIINFHKLACKLKTTIRTGWKYWKVDENRLESVAEHVFGACMLATAIFSTEKTKLNIEKVLTMLLLHETEEILIGDITLFDEEKYKTKKQAGREAVLELFKDFEEADKFLNLISEFEEKKTDEAKFANQVDKLEADLQAQYYSDKVNYSAVSKDIYAHPDIVKLTQKGCKTMGEYFLECDKPLFSGECLEIANYIENKKNL